ncbi:unnamed protein product [Taenia asiatica]|uniref:Uncharacterized protein n=1 Tax=Taenia asiatica TaxID=60517 RepID=A0A0R3WCW8_TAEAS|nr:unnamed protein product [Taenia asiatica]
MTEIALGPPQNSGSTYLLLLLSQGNSQSQPTPHDGRHYFLQDNRQLLRCEWLSIHQQRWQLCTRDDREEINKVDRFDEVEGGIHSHFSDNSVQADRPAQLTLVSC